MQCTINKLWLISLFVGLLQLYRQEDEMKLATQAFDSARSIDPSLALPWAGMSADTIVRYIKCLFLLMYE